LENRPDDLDDFYVPQVDFDVMIDGESVAGRESQTTVVGLLAPSQRYSTLEEEEVCQL
jgi:hypothetical protein